MKFVIYFVGLIFVMFLSGFLSITLAPHNLPVAILIGCALGFPYGFFMPQVLRLID